MPTVVIAVAIQHLVGPAEPAGDGVRLTQAPVAHVWAVYLLTGLAFLAAGSIEWVVLVHLTVAVGAGVVAAVGLARK